MARTIINVPAKVRRGDIVEIKALIQHEMESGFRVRQHGQGIPARHHHGFRVQI